MFAIVSLCLLIFVSHACSIWYVELSSPNPADGPFPLRWGNQEPPDADRVPFPPGWLINGDPCCFKAGATVRLSLKQIAPDPVHGRIVECGVGYLTLYSRVTGEVLRTYPNAYFLPADQPYDFGPLVEWVEYASLELAVYVVYESGWGEDGYHGFVDEMFIVLDEPKSPMNPAWVSVLRISCRWARGETTPDGAARKLTEMTHKNTTYDAEALLFCYPPLPDQGEYFFLKLFMEDPQRKMRGQCNEIADFLCCLMTSVGIRASVQRTNRRPFPIEKAFWTNRLLVKEGELPTYRFHHWHYHQYVLFNYSPQFVYDGTVRFHPLVVHLYYPHQAPDYGYVVGWVRGEVPTDGDWARVETTYRRFLVSPYIPLSDPPQTYAILWEPTPEPSGFIPGVYALDQVTCQR